MVQECRKQVSKKTDNVFPCAFRACRCANLGSQGRWERMHSRGETAHLQPLIYKQSDREYDENCPKNMCIIPSVEFLIELQNARVEPR